MRLQYKYKFRENYYPFIMKVMKMSIGLLADLWLTFDKENEVFGPQMWIKCNVWSRKTKMFYNYSKGTYKKNNWLMRVEMVGTEPLTCWLLCPSNHYTIKRVAHHGTSLNTLLFTSFSVTSNMRARTRSTSSVTSSLITWTDWSISFSSQFRVCHRILNSLAW